MVTKNININRNMRTKSFGGPLWFSLFMIACGYPENPTKKDKQDYKRFLKCIGDVMPCGLCRSSYKSFISSKGDAPLTNKVLKNRETLVFYLMKLKNRINKKIGCRQITKKEMENKRKYFENFRAKTCSKNLKGCTRAQNQNKIPLKIKIITIKDFSALDKKQRKILKSRFGKKKKF